MRRAVAQIDGANALIAHVKLAFGAAPSAELATAIEVGGYINLPAFIIAVLALATMAIQRSGRLVLSVTTEHYHDMGKMMFAFLFFWAYVSFSRPR